MAAHEDNSRLGPIADRLSERLADGEGQHPATEHVAEVVEAKGAEVSDAPIQDFVPLITDRKARDELRAEASIPAGQTIPQDPGPPHEGGEGAGTRPRNC